METNLLLALKQFQHNVEVNPDCLRNLIGEKLKSSRLLKSLQIERSLLSLYCKNQDKHSSHVRSTGQRYNKI